MPSGGASRHRRCGGARTGATDRRPRYGRIGGPWEPRAAAALMVAQRVGWGTLLAHPDVSQWVELRSPFGLMAFHGGLEAGTLEIATAAAASAGASLYAVRQPADLRWHVPSSEVDPGGSQPLARFLGHVDQVVAVHGYGGAHPPHPVLVGGADRELAAEVADGLRAALGGATVIDELDAIPVRLRGVHPGNPVNRAAGGGVQVELPVDLRRHHHREVAGALAAVAARRRDGQRP